VSLTCRIAESAILDVAAIPSDEASVVGLGARYAHMKVSDVGSDYKAFTL